MDKILEVSQLSLGINRKVIVEGIHLSLEDKEFLAVIGPNGSGKSSFIRTLMGEFDRLSGDITFLSQPISSYNHKSRSRYIALMGQKSTADPHMQVFDFISLGRYPHFHYSSRQYDKQCVDGIINDLDISHLLNKQINHLSGGEFQRINLARVLAQEPKLLLLDEPTNHLDPMAKIDLLNLIKNRQIATIAVLHDLPLVERFADKVMILNHGKMQVCDQQDKALSAYWIKNTFGLNTFEVKHPQWTRKMKIFDI